MNELVEADVRYLAQQRPEQIKFILSGMAATMQDIEGKAEAMKSQGWFQRMLKTVTGKNKLTLEEIQQNRDKLNTYMAEAVSELYRLGLVDHSIIMSLGTQINEIYMEHTQLKQLLGAFVVKLNEKIDSVDNFHMLITEIDQGVYTNGLPISNICKILSQFDRRILEDPRKLDIIRRGLTKQNIIRDDTITLDNYIADIFSVPMEEAGQVYMELGIMRSSFIANLSTKVMEGYHFLPDLERKLKSRESLIDKLISEENLDRSVAFSTAEIYDDFVNSKLDIQFGISLSSDSTANASNSISSSSDRVDEASEEELRQDFVLCRKMAEHGNANAQHILGDFYNKGDGGVAQNKLGNRYNNGLGVEQDCVQAVYWYRKAAEQGQVYGQLNLAICYETGNGVEQDYVQSVYWYRKAVEQGNLDAQCNLGYCYDVGRGVGKDSMQAAYWYRQAAEQGSSIAQCKLGVCYSNGYGVEKDEIQAVYWYQKSAEQGNVDASILLKYCNEKGHAFAQYQLGVCYQYGEEVKKSKFEAAYWYRKAAEQGNLSAQYQLGLCYDYGDGVVRDGKQAAYWYRKAAEQGDAQAQYTLGNCYLHADFYGLEKSYRQATNWYRKAAKQNHIDARNALKSIKWYQY